MTFSSERYNQLEAYQVTPYSLLIQLTATKDQHTLQNIFHPVRCLQMGNTLLSKAKTQRLHCYPPRPKVGLPALTQMRR